MNRPQRVAIYCGSAVAIVGLGIAVGFAIGDAASGDGWGTEQVGPLATWVAGLLTLTAVGLAFYQNYESRKNLTDERARNKQEKAETEARHNQQIALAEKQLEVQLQARRIERQTDALVQIVDHLEIVTVESSAYLLMTRGHQEENENAAAKARAIEWGKSTQSRLAQTRMMIPNLHDRAVKIAAIEYTVKVQDLVRTSGYEGVVPEEAFDVIGSRVKEIDVARKAFHAAVLSGEA